MCRTAWVPLTVMCILSKNKTRLRLMGPDQEQDPRDVKRVTGRLESLKSTFQLRARACPAKA
eukprot:2821441-Prymnesium_polylepis.2